MAQHKTDAYKDGFQWVVFCKICGDENPSGDCLGKFVPNSQRKENQASFSKESVDNLVDNKLKCE